ncbi:MAG: hypothetical protein RLN86_02660 [Cyclobacteriaceae bacterium]
MTKVSRREVIKSSALGVAGLTLPIVSSSRPFFFEVSNSERPYPAYPSLEPELVSEVVGKSHFDLDRVRELVESRPELARATWEWRFGDFESAIGAASHVGRRDIIQYLLSKGASPSIFTFATLGANDIVRGMIAYSPGIQTSLGPHGISLLSHAKVGLRMEDSMSKIEIENCKKLIGFLEELSDADGPKYLEIPEKERDAYLGDYKYGDGKADGFTIQLDMRKLATLGPLGGFGGALYKMSENLFTYNGAPSVRVSFQWQDEAVKSVTVKTPDAEVKALRI